MGMHTLHPSAAESVHGRLRCPVRYFAGLTLAAVFSLSSPVEAGLNGSSAVNSTLTTDQRDVSAPALSGSSWSRSSVPTLAPLDPSVGTDPLSMDPMSRAEMLSNHQPAIPTWSLTESTDVVHNAIPKPTDAPPLLIPLPIAASAGAWGLAAVAILIASKRTLRRRLLA